MRRAFTLVELLVVIIIIAIIGGLILGAVQMARTAATRAALTTDIKQIDMALANYQANYGYPPSFGHVAHSDPALRTKARSAVLAHLHKRFSRLRIPGNTIDARWTNFCNLIRNNYQVENPISGALEPLNPNRFDDASSLVFWLGGLPEQAAPSGEWIPAGFHADLAQPLRSGRPRTKPHFRFKNGTVVAVEPHPDAPSDSARVRFLRYYPKRLDAPIVYFKPSRIRANWEYGELDSQTPARLVDFRYSHSATNLCVPYAAPDDPPKWRNHSTCQVITTGLDGEFGTGQQRRTSQTGTGFSLGDFDNQTNFSDGTLEDEID